MKSKQQGLSSFGLLLVLAIAGFFLLCALKLIPMYLDSYFVEASLNKMKNEDLNGLTNRQIRNKLSNHFSIDGIRDLSVRDLKIERDKGRVVLSLSQEKRINFLGNLDVVATFDYRYDTDAPDGK